MVQAKADVGSYEHEGRAERESASCRYELIVHHRSVNSIRLDPSSFRVHNRQQIHQIANNIRRSGFYIPILIADQGKALAGHGRLLTSRLLSMAEILTTCVGHPSPHQIRASTVLDNRHTANSARSQ
jgi:ParB-like chromosome segregation protein Spo0J